MMKSIQEVREAAENDLEIFINLIAPYRVLGSVHKDLIYFWTNPQAKSHQIVLLPRDHGKSAMIAYYVAWYLTNNPHHRVVYISSTANLAEKQLGFIKNILTSDTYRLYWPEMVHPEDSKRERWTATEIMLDHPKRKEEGIRDPSIFTAGLTTNVTGLHFDLAILDDVVVMENAYTQEGRNKVEAQYSLLASVEAGKSLQKVVGTRYHPDDLYSKLLAIHYDTYDVNGELVGSEQLYELFERRVESRGDGTGEFLWPRQQRYDGQWFGFDKEILARKRAQYLDKTQYRAQYYNDPHDPESAGIKGEHFLYFDRSQLSQHQGYWYYNKQKLNLIAAMDLNASDKGAFRRDYTAIVVLGVTGDYKYFVLDIDRYQTADIPEHKGRILRLLEKWGFRKLVIEVGGQQLPTVKAIKEILRTEGIALAIQEQRHTGKQGTKIERILATVEPRYQNLQVWHYRGGNCQILEDELLRENSSTDDCKDALCIAMDNITAPSFFTNTSGAFVRARNGETTRMNDRLAMLTGRSRFGGIV